MKSKIAFWPNKSVTIPKKLITNNSCSFSPNLACECLNASVLKILVSESLGLLTLPKQFPS